ncbi:MAG TPA: SDR family NAD(P)-dependent oxidoreductase [Nocardioides sp.]
MNGVGGGPVVLVTGTSSGIGLATAVLAARSGFRVVATVRDRYRADDRADDLRGAAADAGVSVDVRRLELTDPDSIASCVSGVVASYGRLDALVNNAGVANSNPTLELSDPDVLRGGFETNFFGVIEVCRRAMPHLRAAGGRIVTVGSVRGVVGQPFNEAYSAAKFALEGFMEALAPTAAAVGVSVSMVEPAAVLDTRFVASSGLDPVALLAASGPYTDAFLAYRDFVASGAVDGAQTSAEAAEVIVAALQAERPAFRIPTSPTAERYLALKLADVDGSVVQERTRSWVGAASVSQGS